MIVCLKSSSSDDRKQLPLPEKLRLIFRARVKDAKTEEEHERAERELAKLEADLSGK